MTRKAIQIAERSSRSLTYRRGDNPYPEFYVYARGCGLMLEQVPKKPFFAMLLDEKGKVRALYHYPINCDFDEQVMHKAILGHVVGLLGYEPHTVRFQ